MRRPLAPARRGGVRPSDTRLRGRRGAPSSRRARPTRVPAPFAALRETRCRPSEGAGFELRPGYEPGELPAAGGTSVEWLGASGASVLPCSRPSVGGAGGVGGGRGLRAARTINAVLPTETSTPPMSNPVATQSRNDSLAPRSTSAATPREPSAFIRTTDQSPSRTFHVSVCVPTPEAEAAQKLCSVGGARGAPPETERYVARKGSKSISWTFACATVPRYLATSACGPIPMKRVLPPELSPRIRTLPNQLSFRTQPSPCGVDFEPRARQRVGRSREPLGRRRQVAILALRAVGPEQEASTYQQSQPEQHPDAAENDEDDATSAHWNQRTVTMARGCP